MYLTCSCQKCQCLFIHFHIFIKDVKKMYCFNSFLVSLLTSVLVFGQYAEVTLRGYIDHLDS